jgi:hypothetical protein
MIQYLIKQIAHVTISNCHCVMILLHVSAAIGPLQAGHLQKNTFIINAVKDVPSEVKIQCYQLKYC